MTNTPHSIARALNWDLLDFALVEALQKAWCREACWDGCVAAYPANPQENPSFGNCFVSTLAIWADRGMIDDIIPGTVEGLWHFRLGLKDVAGFYERDAFHRVHVDLTRQQFPEDSPFRMLHPQLPLVADEYRTVMAVALWHDERLESRLDVLLRNMRDLGGYEFPYSAEKVVNDARVMHRFIFETHAHRARFSGCDFTQN